MATRYSAFWLPRRGNKPEEYEDAFAADPAAGRFAVADGASQSAFAGSWARLLVDEFVRDSRREADHWTEGLPDAQRRWGDEIGGGALPWYARAKFEQGAFATFLGLTVARAADGTAAWRAAAVGDTCLFHCRDEELLRAFPLEASSRFDNYPNLVGSRTPPEHVREKLNVCADGDAQPGDRLWLMTDAVAQYCLAEHEAGRAPWAALESLRDSPERGRRFAAWIDRLRDAGHMSNDDVTLLAVSL